MLQTTSTTREMCAWTKGGATSWFVCVYITPALPLWRSAASAGIQDGCWDWLKKVAHACAVLHLAATYMDTFFLVLVPQFSLPQWLQMPYQACPKLCDCGTSIGKSRVGGLGSPIFQAKGMHGKPSPACHNLPQLTHFYAAKSGETTYACHLL